MGWELTRHGVVGGGFYMIDGEQCRVCLVVGN